MQNIAFPIETLLGSAEGVDHTAPVDVVSTAPLSILTALQPLVPPEADAAAGEHDDDAGEHEDDADAKKRSKGGERGARWSAAERGLLAKSIIAGSQPARLK